MTLYVSLLFFALIWCSNVMPAMAQRALQEGLVKIVSPPEGATFKVGEVLTMEGMGIDGSTGLRIPDEYLTWNVVYNTFPAQQVFANNVVGNNVSLTPIPNPGSFQALQVSYVRVTLTVVFPATNLAVTQTRDIFPSRVDAFFDSNQDPIYVRVMGGIMVFTPGTFTGWENQRLTISAPDQRPWVFLKWEHGGEQTQDIVLTKDGPNAYTAIYVEPTDDPTMSPSLELTPEPSAGPTATPTAGATTALSPAPSQPVQGEDDVEDLIEILSPAENATFKVGEVLTMEGIGIDGSTGLRVPDEYLTWNVVYNTFRAQQVFANNVVGNNVALTAIPNPVSFLSLQVSFVSVTLSVFFPSSNKTVTQTRDIYPSLVDVFFTSNQDPIYVLVMGNSMVFTPGVFTGWENQRLTMTAPDQRPYVFLEWEHGGNQTQEIVLSNDGPETATYTALYARATADPTASPSLRQTPGLTATPTEVSPAPSKTPGLRQSSPPTTSANEPPSPVPTMTRTVRQTLQPTAAEEERTAFPSKPSSVPVPKPTVQPTVTASGGGSSTTPILDLILCRFFNRC